MRKHRVNVGTIGHVDYGLATLPSAIRSFLDTDHPLMFKEFIWQVPGDYRVEFVPQAWMNDYAIEVDPEGETEWVVEADEITNPYMLVDDQYESDELRFSRNAPDWVQDWSGPFCVRILGRV